MRNLRLPLKRNWFEMTKSGIKTEDYREITPYWCNRLLTFQGLNLSKDHWEYEFLKYGTIDEQIENFEIFCKFKKFSYNIMTLGYPKKIEKNRHLKYKNLGIKIAKGNENWGAEPNKFYFVIKHGTKLVEL